MPCYSNCRYTSFGPYYPCPVTTSVCNCSENTVVNPALTENFIFLILSSPTPIESESTIPVVLSSFGGSGITLPETGVVGLVPGTYQATYNVTSIIGADGENSFALTLNGSVIAPSVSRTEGTSGENSSLTNSVIFSVTENSELRLINNGDETVTVNLANLTVRRIS